MPEARSKTVNLEVRIWWDEADGHIHMAAKKEGLITTVTADPNSVRCHPNLFMKLAKVLRDHGAPYPPIQEEADALANEKRAPL
jgi:hypothetical protein